MSSRTPVAGRPTSVSASVLGLLVCVAAALALGATPAVAAEPCRVKGGETEPERQQREQTEQRRSESNINSATGEPYSAGLPDCRAYEVVSPRYKQGQDALASYLDGGLPVSPDGNTAGFFSVGVFAGAENFLSKFLFSEYLAQRGASGWVASSTNAPRSLLDSPSGLGINGDSTLDLRSARLSCGENPAGREPAENPALGIACIRRQANGPWAPTPTYRPSNGIAAVASEYGGASSDLSRAFILTGGSSSYLPSATHGYGLYEVSGVGSESPVLRLVNVSEGTELKSVSETQASLGTNEGGGAVGYGSRYQAISRSGETVIFTAVPPAPPPPAVPPPAVPTVYARVACHTGIHCEYVEEVNEGRVEKEGPKNLRGEPTGRETVAISNPSVEDCSICLAMAERKPSAALYQGASADGSKVFFTTHQKLLNGDSDESANLYEYDFNAAPGKKLVKLSVPEGKSAEVLGVLRPSSDGSHVYFVARSKLKGALQKNKTVNEEDKPFEEEAKEKEGQPNLYGSRCELSAGETKCETKFVASTNVRGIASEYSEAVEDRGRTGQITPDGRYLVFSSSPCLEPSDPTCTDRLAGALNKGPQPGKEFTGEAVYRYDFQTRQLTWVSHSAPCVEGEKAPCSQNFKTENAGKEAYKGEGESAIVPPVPGGLVGADANVNDFNRAISGCPTKGERSEAEELEFNCPEGTYDGEYIIFETAEKLQANDENHAPDVYEWHCPSPCEGRGEVHLISDGRDPLGVATREIEGKGNVKGVGAEAADSVGMSASGSDIFFATKAALVQQDTDELGDLYDARIYGGFPAPTEPACSGEACQGSPSPLPSFPPAASSTSPAAGNLVPPPITAAPSTEPKPKELTRAQKLAKALKACRGKPRKRRAVCESQARKRYGSKANARKTHRRKSTHRRGK